MKVYRGSDSFHLILSWWDEGETWAGNGDVWYAYWRNSRWSIWDLSTEEEQTLENQGCSLHYQGIGLDFILLVLKEPLKIRRGKWESKLFTRWSIYQVCEALDWEKRMGNQLVGYHICAGSEEHWTNGGFRAGICKLFFKGPSINILGIVCHNYSLCFVVRKQP